MRHTVIIPSYNTLAHLKNTYESLKRYAPEVDIIAIDDASEDGTWQWLNSLDDNKLQILIAGDRRGHTFWYDEGMRHANTDVVSILHSDMIIGPGYFENMLKHLEKGKVVCATRIEPPIHPPGKEKIVRDFGDEAHNFKWNAFENFVNSEKDSQSNVTTRGIFAPWMLYKEDHLSIGGHDQRFAPYGYEDSDIFNRFLLNGYKFIQTWKGFVYHMTCRGSRFADGAKRNPDGQVFMKNRETDEWLKQNQKSTREFLRKWGHFCKHDALLKPIIPPKYDIGFVVENCDNNMLKELEPWCSTIYVDCDYVDYIKDEQKNTAFDLSDRVKPYDNEKNNDIIEIKIKSRSFLKQQVRSIVGCLKYVGEKKWTINKFKKVLKSKNRNLCAPPAPGTGLYLEKVIY